MKYKAVYKNGKYRKKIVLEWHEKLAFIVIILADVYILAQIIRYIAVRQKTLLNNGVEYVYKEKE